MHEVETQLNQLSGSNQDLSPGGGSDLRHSTSDLSMASNSTGDHLDNDEIITLQFCHSKINL